MNQVHRELLMSYLQESEIVILGINFLRGGHVSGDLLTILYHRQDGKNWTLNTDTISPSGEISKRSVKSMGPR